MKKIALLLAILLITGCGAQSDSTAAYPDKVTLYREQAGEIVTLNIRDYIIGCLGGELSPSVHEEALKAAAVVFASNALYSLQNGEKQLGADFSDIETSCLTSRQLREQYAGSYDYYMEKLGAAADYGLQRQLTYNGEPVYVPYCQISTGVTDDGGAAWLPSVIAAADKECEEGSSTKAYSAEQVRGTLAPMLGITRLTADCGKWFYDPEYTSGGTLVGISFGGVRLSGDRLMEAFGLRSAAITVEYSEERFVFRVSGIGSNLGMSLNQAAVMAQNGATAEQILCCFYPETELHCQ